MDICEISLVYLYKTVSMASSCHGELCKTETEHDGFHVITRRLSCAYDIYSSFNSMRHTQGSNEWLGSQLRRNGRDTNLISNSRRRFPAVIGALIDLKQKPKSFHWILFPSSPKASWALKFQAILAPRMVRFSILSWCQSG